MHECVHVGLVSKSNTLLSFPPVHSTIANGHTSEEQLLRDLLEIETDIKELGMCTKDSLLIIVGDYDLISITKPSPKFFKWTLKANKLYFTDAFFLSFWHTKVV